MLCCNLVPHRIRRSPLSSSLSAPCRVSLPASAAIAGISTSPACTPRSAPNTSLIASSHFPLTQFHVAFVTATANIDNYLGNMVKRLRRKLTLVDYQLPISQDSTCPIRLFNNHLLIRRHARNTGAQAGQRGNGASHESKFNAYWRSQ
jgi:hypothetical protein